MTQQTSAPLFENWSPEMSLAECVDGVWSPPRTVPCGELSIHPGAMGIQFAQSVFEGCKAFWDGEGDALTFRLQDHHDRIAASCERLRMPLPPRELFLEAIESQVRRKSSWTVPFSSEVLYIRPVLYGDDAHVMPLPSVRNTFVVLTAPLRMFPGRRLSLFAERQFSRAAPGGLGAVKTAASYAHQYFPSLRAREAGCDAVLWMDAETHSYVEEASTMNLFAVLDGKLVTPPLGGTILPGITRRSVLALATERHGWEIVERRIALDELAAAAEAGALTEVFTASTALGMQTVGRIVDDGREIILPPETPRREALQADLLAIQRGEADDPYGWTTRVRVS
jgi:branched-chain amino acid aminotransferase